MNKDYEYVAFFIYTCSKCGIRIRHHTHYSNDEKKLKVYLNKQPDKLTMWCSQCNDLKEFINKECYVHIKKKDECLHIDWYKLGIIQ